jgi:EAL domain-containing protein (putative c-di-GMP-specific phosphodiesterase class I)
MVLAAQTRLAERLRELFCLSAAEESLHHPGQKLFLPLESNEIDVASLEGLLTRLLAVLPDLSTVVFEVPDCDVNDVGDFHQWYGRIRDRGASLCYRDFAAGRARLEEHRRTPPDFIKLSPTMVRGVFQDANRRTACEALIKACRELDCQAIAPGLDQLDQADLFRTLGCPYGQGNACQKQPAAKEKLFENFARTTLLRESVLT